MWDVNYDETLHQRPLWSAQKTPWWLLNDKFHVFDHFRPPRVKTALAEHQNRKSYKKYCDIVEPDAVNIDYEVNPKKIIEDIQIPVQGGVDPKTMLTDKENLKKEAKRYLDIFKDHPYIFNLGHGILPETKIDLVEELIDIVRNYKWKLL